MFKVLRITLTNDDKKDIGIVHPSLTECKTHSVRLTNCFGVQKGKYFSCTVIIQFVNVLLGILLCFPDIDFCMIYARKLWVNSVTKEF